jgi:thiamine biosynthesis lipoprotein
MRPAPVFHHTFPAMGTRFSLVLPDVDQTAGEALANFAEAEVRAQERLMSRFDDHSPLSEINRRAAFEPVQPPAPLWEILTLCHEHWERSGGAFDIAQTPLVELWRESSRRHEAPAAAALLAARRKAGFHLVRLDVPSRTVRFATDGVQLDLGGIGKGIALAKVAQDFQQRGIQRAFFSFGESSITVIGSHPAGTDWPVGIADLFQPAVALHTFPLRDASLSTSGNAPVPGGGFGHIINVRNGLAVTGYRTLSIVSVSAVAAEVLSTALLAVPRAERAPLLAAYPHVSAVEIIYEPQNGTWAGRVDWQHES